jgi:hypothetical protein
MRTLKATHEQKACQIICCLASCGMAALQVSVRQDLGTWKRFNQHLPVQTNLNIGHLPTLQLTHNHYTVTTRSAVFRIKAIIMSNPAPKSNKKDSARFAVAQVKDDT